MLTDSLATKIVSPLQVGRLWARPPSAAALPLERRRRDGNGVALSIEGRTAARDGGAALHVLHPTVETSPADLTKRRAVAWRGIAAEIVQATRREKVEYSYHGPFHLLAVYEQAARALGETFVEGLPRSSLRDLRKKLTFVPAGHSYNEWHEPRVLGRIVYFYFDPTLVLDDGGMDLREFGPRLYFEDRTLWDTAMKLAGLVESARADDRPYLEALGLVLTHELGLGDRSASSTHESARGGLAAWQQKIVSAFIEEHLAEQISLATLAQLARLSPFYFCRAFKQSFGIPPHRYHTNRRIERAKVLLTGASLSVTEVGMKVGFSEASSFTTAFRRVTGLTPRTFHRSLT